MREIGLREIECGFCCVVVVLFLRRFLEQYIVSGRKDLTTPFCADLEKVTVVIGLVTLGDYFKPSDVSLKPREIG